MAIDSASQMLVTVRQIFSDDPATEKQAFSCASAVSLFQPTAAWPCRKVLMSPAPLSKRFNFE